MVKIQKSLKIVKKSISQYRSNPLFYLPVFLSESSLIEMRTVHGHEWAGFCLFWFLVQIFIAFNLLSVISIIFLLNFDFLFFAKSVKIHCVPIIIWFLGFISDFFVTRIEIYFSNLRWTSISQSLPQSKIWK